MDHNALNPAAFNQVRLAGGENERIALYVSIRDPEIVALVRGLLFAEPTERVVDFLAIAIEIPIHDQPQQLVMSGSPDVLGEREQVREVVLR